jgi:hypothetical protein
MADKVPGPVGIARCTHCGASVEDELHPCPYQAEVCDNSEPYCNCCEQCVDECKDDI